MGSLFSTLHHCWPVDWWPQARLLRAGQSEDSEVEATGATPKRRALLVGISYQHTQSNMWMPLDGPHEDVERFRKLLLETYKYSPEDITVLKDDPSLPALSQPTRANMVRVVLYLQSVRCVLTGVTDSRNEAACFGCQPR
jgi:hypothetical protein